MASGSVLAGQALGELTHLGDTAGIVIFTAVTAPMAAIGYRDIHALGRLGAGVEGSTPTPLRLWGRRSSTS